jgi:fructose/tagatose bisphosphate aldolase
MIFQNVDQLKKGLEGILEITEKDVRLLDEGKLRQALIDKLIYSYVFSADEGVKASADWLIRRAGAAVGNIPSSIQSLYEARGRKEVSGFTVPAINIRVLTYDVAQAVLHAAMKSQVGAFILEIARSEIDYTMQRPAEYICAVIAAAIKTGYQGPLFIQGDHFQVNARQYAGNPDQEVRAVKDLIWEALESGFYNIDIDTSTLVDLSKPTVQEQQRVNYTLAAEFTRMIRDLEPPGITVSVGGEIGEVGGKNSTDEELSAFMDGYLEELGKNGQKLKGISKISVQTGTTHGGIPMPDGSIARVKLDFDTLQRLSEVSRSKYERAGAVQHGASTLPEEAFDKFPSIETAEIHLATGFQNIIYDSASFPVSLRDKIYDHLKAEFASEWKKPDTEEQFIYKTRKKGLGPFKKDLWDLPAEVVNAISQELETQFAFLFEKLNVNNTVDIVAKFVKPMDVPISVPTYLKK